MATTTIDTENGLILLTEDSLDLSIEGSIPPVDSELPNAVTGISCLTGGGQIDIR